MSIAVICEHCQATFKVKDRFAGKRGKCPKCAGPIEIPALDDDDDDDEVVVMLSASAEKQPKPSVPKADESTSTSMTQSPEDDSITVEPAATQNDAAEDPMPVGLVLDQGPPVAVPRLEIDDDDIPVIKPVSASAGSQNNRVIPTAPVGLRLEPATPETPAAVPAVNVTPILASPAPVAVTPQPAAPLTPIPVAPLAAAPLAATPVTAAPLSAAPVTAAPLTPVTAVPVTAIPVLAAAMVDTATPVQPLQVTSSPMPVLSTGGTGTAEEIPPYSQQLSDELLNSFQGQIEPVESSAGYGLSLVLVAIFMVLLPMVYIGMIFGIAYWMLKLGVLGIIVGSILLLFLIKPIFVWPGRSPGIREVTPDQEPLLFSFIDRLCQIVGAPMPRQIEIDCDVNASASFRRGYRSMFMSSDLRLTIGMPFVAGLTLRQFTGVLGASRK